MDRIVFFNITTSIGVFVSLLLSFFLLTVKTDNKQANRLFASFLILSAIDLSGLSKLSFMEYNADLEIFRWTACLLIMPFFYLYVLSVCYIDFRLKPKHLIHTIPFISVNLILLPRFYLSEGAEREFVFQHINTMPELYAFQIIVEAQYLFSKITLMPAHQPINGCSK